MLVAVRVDSLITTDWNDLIGLTSTISQGRIWPACLAKRRHPSLLGRGDFSAPGLRLGSGAGDSVIFGFNYDAGTGTVQLWDSLNDTIATWTKASGDFSTGGTAL